MKTIDILIADDHSLVASGIQAILETTENLKPVATVENGVEVLKFLEKTLVDVILMDINMPLMNGIVCTKKVKEKYPEIKVIALTMFKQLQFMRDLMEAGADGCILKNNSGKELLVAINRVQDGQTYFDQLTSFVDVEKELVQYELTKREVELIALISEGLTSKDIAEQLFISEHTVKTHRKNIFRKTDVKSADELIQFAINNKLL